MARERDRPRRSCTRGVREGGADDGRVGVAVTNRTSDDGLRALAQRAGEVAVSSPVDEHFPGLPTPAPVPDVDGYDEETAALGP